MKKRNLDLGSMNVSQAISGLTVYLQSFSVATVHRISWPGLVVEASVNKLINKIHNLEGEVILLEELLIDVNNIDYTEQIKINFEGILYSLTDES